MSAVICTYLVIALGCEWRLLISFFFFKQKTAYEMRISDWSSDVCSSDLMLIDRAIGAAERGASLTQRLLAFSRKQTLLPRLTDVNRLVIDMSDMLVRTLGETIEVAPSLCREPCYSRVDPNQLEAAILNLAVNARDAMPDGGRLTIATLAAPVEKNGSSRFPELEIGRASCRERVCQYVEISGVAGSIKKKQKQHKQ